MKMKFLLTLIDRPLGDVTDSGRFDYDEHCEALDGYATQAVRAAHKPNVKDGEGREVETGKEHETQ